MALTDIAIRSAAPTAKRRKLADERGLFLQINPGGSKLWRFKYRFGGKEKLLALGAYPEISLREARNRREEARRLVAEGTDPGAKRREARIRQSGADTFGAIANTWLKHQSHVWSEGHAVTVRSRLERDVLPYLGKRPAHEITAQDVLAVLRRVESRGAIESAHRIKTVCGQVFKHAIGEGRINRNPVADIGSSALKTVIPKPMAAILTPSGIGALLKAIDDYKGTHVVRCAFRLAPLVFVRPGELRAAEWKEFDLAGAQWTIPAARMKLSKVQKADANRSHIVPLSRQAIEILQDIRQLTGDGKYVFPGARTTLRPMSEGAITAALRRMDYDGDTMTWHGFRSIASTMLNERGYLSDAIEAQLAHTAGGVRAAYNRARYLESRKAMMQEWADYLDTLKV